MSDTPKTTCPTCNKPTTHAFRPFCSKRCAEIDLGHWFQGKYSLPAEEEADPEELAVALMEEMQKSENGEI